MTGKDIELRGREFKVSVTEKRSLGDYENISPHAAIEGDIEMVGDLDEDARRAIEAKLLALHKTLQSVVERCADNRVAVPEAEDWGVRNGGSEDE